MSALHDIKIEDDHIVDVIQGRPTVLPDDVKETIFTTVRNYAAGILDKLRELQVDLRATPAIFTGGGAALFKTFLEESPLVVKAGFIQDSKANAIGYNFLAAAQMGRALPQIGGDSGVCGSQIPVFTPMGK